MNESLEAYGPKIAIHPPARQSGKKTRMLDEVERRAGERFKSGQDRYTAKVLLKPDRRGRARSTYVMLERQETDRGVRWVVGKARRHVDKEMTAELKDLGLGKIVHYYHVGPTTEHKTQKVAARAVRELVEKCL